MSVHDFSVIVLTAESSARLLHGQICNVTFAMIAIRGVRILLIGVLVGIGAIRF